MLRTKTVAGVVSFAIALAIPWWTVSPGTSSAAAGSTATAAAQAGHDAMDSGSSSDTPTASASPQDWQAMDKAMLARDKSFPARTQGKGGQAIQPTILADGTKAFTLTAKPIKWETEPGKFVDAMAYNGQIPGPTIHVNVGDKVQVTLKNELPESTVIHWHGIPIDNQYDGVADITQPPVTPGHSFTYKINASRVSVGWYHSHHNGTEQVPDGLWGSFLIGELPLPVPNVKPVVEMPFQLQDAGALGITLNGKSFPATEPIRVKKDQWVEVHYVNAGTMMHPWHLHGVDQLVIAKDGFPLKAPYKADTVPVAPGERYTVLIKADRVGTWAWHCHIFPHSEGAQGMFGMFTELIVT